MSHGTTTDAVPWWEAFDHRQDPSLPIECMCGNSWPCGFMVLMQQRDAARAELARVTALVAAGHTLACEAHLVVESWHAGHIEGMVELSLAERAWFASERAAGSGEGE